MNIRQLYNEVFDVTKIEDPDLERAISHAEHHYTDAKSPEEALLKSFHRGLEHSKEDDQYLKDRVKKLEKKLNDLTQKINDLQITNSNEFK